MKTRLKKLHNLKRLSFIAEGKERQLRHGWLAAQADHEACLQQEAQLKEYLQHYVKVESCETVAPLFINQQNMLNQIRQAQAQQQIETARCQQNEIAQFSLWKSQYQEKKSYDKFAHRCQQQIVQVEKKADSKVTDELAMQLFFKKCQKNY